MAAEIETHPHKPFVPSNATVLIVGSFPGKNNSSAVTGKEWFYASKRNQFWKIISYVYDTDLATTADKKKLFEEKRIAIADILLKIRRKENTNSDTNLEVIEYNDKALSKILKDNQFSSIFFTSKFVEKIFTTLFPTITNGVCLPSPSPRYARISLVDKIEFYKLQLPE